MKLSIMKIICNFMLAVFLLLNHLVDAEALKCMNELEIHNGECFYKGKCCAKFASDECRKELSQYDASAPRVEFLNNSLSFDRDRDMLCIHGLASPQVGEKLADLHGFEMHVRKEDRRSRVQDTTRVTFMFKEPLEGTVPRDSNVLQDLFMCIPLGTKINSISPEGTVFISLQMIPLKPQKGHKPVEYPGYLYLHLLESPVIKRKAKCELISVERVPYELEIDEPIITPVGGNDLGMSPGKDTSSNKDDGSRNDNLDTTGGDATWGDRNWTTMMTVIVLSLLAFNICTVITTALLCNRSKKRDIGKLKEILPIPDTLTHQHPLFALNPIDQAPNIHNGTLNQNSTRMNPRTIRPLTHSAGLETIPRIGDAQPMYHILDRSESKAPSHQYSDINYETMTSVQPAVKTTNKMEKIEPNNREKSKLRVELEPVGSNMRNGRMMYDPVATEGEAEFPPIEEDYDNHSVKNQLDTQDENNNGDRQLYINDSQVSQI